MKNFNIIDKQGIKLNTANKYVNDDINVGLSKIDKDNLVAENIKKDVNILGVVGTHEGGASLNLAYGTTPPTDTSKIWLQCAEPSGVEVQNYLGECAVSDVANWGVISNPTTDTDYFSSGRFSPCYIGNNQIAIVGKNHIRIYDLSTKSYTADYTISVGTNYYYSNVLFKDNVLYFGYDKYLYSYNLTTQTLTTLNTYSSSDEILFICFYNNKLKLFIHDGNWGYSTVYEFDMNSGTGTQLISQSTYSDRYANRHYGELVVKANNYVYNFYYGGSSNTKYGGWKYNLVSDSYDYLTSWNNFVENLGFTSYTYLSAVFDNDRFIYIIGGLTNISKSDLIIRYDTINNTFELLDNKLIEAKYNHFSVLVDNRIYMFGGLTWTENNNTYGRPNQIDYFDLSYPLTQNNAIITTNTINTDNALPLINTDKLKLNSNIASAYKGNADNLAEKVNAYYYDGYGWVGINCDDYTIYFSWDTLPTLSCALHNNVAIDLSQYYHTNGEPTLSASVAGGGMTSNINGTVLDITNNSSSSAQAIVITATVNNTEYQTTLTVDVPATTSEENTTINDLS